MTLNLPFLLITLQFRQIFLIDALTFIITSKDDARNFLRQLMGSAWPTRQTLQIGLFK